MSLLGNATPKSKRISKRHTRLENHVTSPRRKQKNKEENQKNSPKGSFEKFPDLRISIPNENTIKNEKGKVHLNFFQSFNSYTLGSINSITFYNGKIYDLLQIRKNSSRTSKLTKCRCSKSKCIAKYCDCFSQGKACNPLCGCEGCQNTTDTGVMKSFMGEDRICRCSKSECQKNYCQCFQRGELCKRQCRCENCKNGGREGKA